MFKNFAKNSVVKNIFADRRNFVGSGNISVKDILKL